MDIFTEIIDKQRQLSNLEHKYWSDNVVFSLNWWILFLVTTIPWIVWWKLVDKKRAKEILLYGFYVMIISAIFDDFGLALTLWAYPYQLVQIMDRLNSIDISILPIIYMLVYQYFPKSKHFIAANIFISAIFAFVLEPILVSMNMYIKLNWKYIYSFPIYFLIAVTGRWLIMKINKVSKTS